MGEKKNEKLKKNYHNSMNQNLPDHFETITKFEGQQKNNHVIFVGYRILHPLKREAITKIQTDGAKIKNPTDDKEAIWTPLEAIKYALTNLENLLKSLHENFDEFNSQ